jgi:hypothetical protein
MPVVPAKAGTQWRSLHNATGATTLDSRFRGNDEERDRGNDATIIVVPAKAGTHLATAKNQWIPAFAGMTNVRSRE